MRHSQSFFWNGHKINVLRTVECMRPGSTQAPKGDDGMFPIAQLCTPVDYTKQCCCKMISTYERSLLVSHHQPRHPKWVHSAMVLYSFSCLLRLPFRLRKRVQEAACVIWSSRGRLRHQTTPENSNFRGPRLVYTYNAVQQYSDIVSCAFELRTVMLRRSDGASMARGREDGKIKKSTRSGRIYTASPRGPPVVLNSPRGVRGTAPFWPPSQCPRLTPHSTAVTKNGVDTCPYPNSALSL